MQVSNLEASASSVAAAAAARTHGAVAVPEGMHAVYQQVRSLAATNTVVVFTLSGCCMCLVVKKLLFGLGVAPTFLEIETGGDTHVLLEKIAAKTKGDGQNRAVPTVFVGGKYLGGVGKLVECHVNSTLVPLLKDAGALWL